MKKKAQKCKRVIRDRGDIISRDIFEENGDQDGGSSSALMHSNQSRRHVLLPNSKGN